MKALYLVSMFILISATNSNAQSDLPPKKNRAKVVTSQGTFIGAITQVQDSSIVMMTKKDGISESLKLNYNEIDIIRIRKKNSIRKGLLIGTLAGAGAGALFAFMEGDDPGVGYDQWEAKDKAVVYAIPGAMIGAVIGPLVGTIKTEFTINKTFNKFRYASTNLRKYVER
jgi:hypothetical protein